MGKATILASINCKDMYVGACSSSPLRLCLVGRSAALEFRYIQHFVLKMMNFVLKMIAFALKIVNFVFKMANSALKTKADLHLKAI